MENDPDLTSPAIMVNTYAAEFRSKAEGVVKQLLLVSGGIQTITIGIFINGNNPSNNLNPDTICLLKYGWVFFTTSIILCLCFMCSQVIGQQRVLTKQIKHLEKRKRPKKAKKIKAFNMHPCHQNLNWFMGLSAFLSCIIGVLLIAIAAISLISSSA